MPLPNLYGTTLGLDRADSSNGATQFNLANSGTAIAGRFQAFTPSVPSSIWLNWGTVTAPVANTFEVRIENVDVSGRPNGSLYTANATKTFTPAPNTWQNIIFDSSPSAYTVGSYYGLVVRNNNGGTTTAQNRGSSAGAYNFSAFTTPLVGVTGWTELANSVFVAYTQNADNSVERYGFCPFPGTGGVSRLYFGNIAVGIKFTVPNTQLWRVDGYRFTNVVAGTPASDIRYGIYQDGTSLLPIASSVYVLPKAYLNTTLRNSYLTFPSPVFVSGGTYRLLMSNDTGGGTAANSFGLYCLGVNDSGVFNQITAQAGTSNSGTSPVVWDLDMPLVHLIGGLVVGDIQTLTTSSPTPTPTPTPSPAAQIGFHSPFINWV